MKTQKSLNRQSNLEEKKMELEESTYLISDYTTKLQLLRQYVTGRKTEVQANGTRQKAQRKTLTHMGTLSLTQEARIYDGNKTALSISGAGRTGQLSAKE